MPGLLCNISRAYTHPGKVSSSAVKNGRSALALENNETQALLKQLSSIEKTVN